MDLDGHGWRWMEMGGVGCMVQQYLIAPQHIQDAMCANFKEKFEFFGLNLGKLSNYMQYFGSNNVERAGWRLKHAGWRQVELGGG